MNWENFKNKTIKNVPLALKVIKFGEEIGELQQVLAKQCFTDRYRKKILAEIKDVETMLTQIKKEL